MNGFTASQLVICYDYYACGTIVRGYSHGVVIERQDVWGYEGYLILVDGKDKPIRYNADEVEDYEEFMERQNKFKNENSRG